MSCYLRALPRRFVSLVLVITFLFSSFGGYYAPAAHAEGSPLPSTPLSAVDAGSIVRFGDCELDWIVLDPTIGLLLLRYDWGEVRPFSYGSGGVQTFDPGQDGNIGQYLNVDFLEWLPEKAQGLILVKPWAINSEDGTYEAGTFHEKVGLLCLDQILEYKSVLKDHPLAEERSIWWISTYEVGEGGAKSNYCINGFDADDNPIVIVEDNPWASCYVRPAAYVAGTTSVVVVEGIYSPHYVVSYREPDGELLFQETVDVGDVPNRPLTDPTKTDFLFTGWYWDKTLASPCGFDQPVTEDLSIYASFKGTGNSILSFTFPGQVDDVYFNPDLPSITLWLSYGTDPSALTPTITISPNASITPSGGPLDFTTTVTYVVTSEMGEDRDWRINCIVNKNPDNDILSFEVEGQIGESEIDKAERTVGFAMPYGTDASGLKPSIEVSPDARISPISGAERDFSEGPLEYMVTSESLESVWWTVTCTILPNVENAIIGFQVPGQVGSSIVEFGAHTVVFRMPYGSDITNLTPTIITSEHATVSPSSGSPESFTTPVTYTVTAGSGATQDWVITCIVNPNTANDIVGFSVPGQVGDSQMDAVAHTVTFHLPYGTNVTALEPSVAVSDHATVLPASGIPQGFAAPVTYTVTSASGANQAWVITCIIDPNTANDILSFEVVGQIGDSVIDKTDHTVTFHVPYGTDVTSLVPTISVSADGSTAPTSGTSQSFVTSVTYTVTSQSGTPETWMVSCVVNPNTENDIVSFSVPGQVGGSQINPDDHTVTFHMPYGTNVTALEPIISVSDHAMTSPESGSAKDFTGTVIYTVTAASGATQEWVVTCIINPNTANDITSFSIPGQVGGSHIDSVAHTVTLHVPYGTSVTALVPTIDVSAGASVDPASDIAQDFSDTVTYTVTSQSGTPQVWVVTCIVNPNTANAIVGFSVPGQIGDSHIDADDHTVTFHMPYGTDITALKPIVAVSDHATVSPTSDIAQDFSDTVTYTVTSQSGTPQVWVVTCIVNPNTANAIVGFSVPGQMGDSHIDAVAHTVTFHMPYGTTVADLIPTISVSADGSLAPAGGISRDFTTPVTYTVTSQSGTPLDWVVTCVVDPNTANDIVGFEVEGQVGESVMDKTNYTVTFHMPYGTDVTNLIPTITVSAGASVDPASDAAQDFSGTVTYTITSQSGTPKDWVVTCVVDANMANDILGFDVEGQVGESVIDHKDHAVTFHMPYGTDVTTLIPNITFSTGGSIVPASGTAQNFTAPVTYTVTSQSGSAQGWTVMCVADPNTANNIIGFSVPGQVGDSQIIITAHTVTFHVSYGTDVTALVPNISLSADGSIAPASGVTQNFTTPVIYTVTSQSGLPQDWVVTCAVDANTANNIISFVVPGQVGSSIVDASRHTVTFQIPYGVSISSVRPEISVSPQATVKPQSGITPTFVNGTAVYTVTAGSGAAQIWLVSYHIYYPPEDDTPPPAPPQQVQQEKLEEAVVAVKAATLQVATGAAASITHKDAVLSGTIVSDGEGEIQTGFRYRAVGASLWSYTSTKTLQLADGDSFFADVSSLLPNTVYEFEARAANNLGMSQGRIESFTTKKAKAPTVLTLSADATDLGKMHLQGAVLEDGGAKITSSGFLWGELPDALTEEDLSTEKNLSLTLSDLKVGATYYYSAFAENSGGRALGELLSFVVPGTVVTTLLPTEITGYTAILQGSMVGGAEIQECGFTLTPSEVGGFSAQVDEEGNFSVEIEDLEPGTKYYCIAYAKTASVEYSGQVVEFAPLDEFPEVETLEAEEVGRNMGIVGGYIHKNKGYPILDSGFVWGEDPNPEFELSVSEAPDSRTMAFRLVGLKPDTGYYYKAYAKNEKGTGFGEVSMFTTLPPTAPAVSTSAAGFDGANGQWVLVGNVDDNGGESLYEYGFRLSGDGKSWISLPRGFDVSGNYVSRGLPVFGDLEPGTYFVKAYAINSIGEGEGEVISIVIPNLPKVTTLAAKEGELGSATLRGSISSTGATGALCYTTLFRYRVLGSLDWQVVGTNRGDFGPVDFSYEVTGLLPGESYEYVAEASNSYGGGEGTPMSFTMGYGKTPQDALTYLLGIGKTAMEVTNILKAKYRLGFDDCVELFYANGYSAMDIAAAMSASLYQTSRYEGNHRPMSSVLRRVGTNAGEVAEAILTYYKDPLLYGSPGGRLEDGLIQVLGAAGYTLQEIMQTMVDLLAYGTEDCIFQFTAGSLYSRDQVYSAISQVLGLDTLVEYLWAKGSRLPTVQRSSEVIKIMRDTGFLEPFAIGERLQRLHPALTALELLNGFFDAGYPFGDIASVIAQIYGGDPLDLAAVFGSSRYQKDVIVPVLAGDPAYSAISMVQIVTGVWKNWKDPMAASASILKDYYHLGALESAKVLYAAGWTEKNTGGGNYGLAQLISCLQTYYGQNTDDALIGTLKGVGLPALEIAMNIPRQEGWLLAYRNHGFSATDVAAYVQKSYSGYGLNERSQMGTTVKWCDETGYSLVDIGLALRGVYGADMATALQYMLDNTKKDAADISEALSEAYGTNPIIDALRKTAGQPMRAVSALLRNTYKVTSPQTAIKYLGEAGYSTQEILSAMAGGYFDPRPGESWDAYLAFAETTIPEATFADILNAVIRVYGAEPDTKNVTSWLINLGYDIGSAASIMKESYASSYMDVIGAMASRFGRVKEPEFTPLVMAAYGMNLASYMEFERARGMTATQSAATLVGVFGMTTPDEVAAILAGAGYGKQEVSDAVVQVFFHGHITSDVLATIERILRDHFSFSDMDAVRVLLRDGEVRPVSHAIREMHDAGYGLPVILIALKDLYSLDEDEVVAELGALRLYSQQELSSAIDEAYGKDYVVMIIQGWAREPWGNPVSIARRLQIDAGISDPSAIFKYMRRAGIPEPSAIDAVMAVFFNGRLSREAVSMITEISGDRPVLEQQMEVVRSLLEGARLHTYSPQVISAMHSAGFDLEMIVRTLKEIYLLSETEVVAELSALRLFSQQELSSATRQVYGKDYVLLLIQGWLGEPWGSAEGIFRHLKDDAGLGDLVEVVKYMRRAGISETEVMNALYLSEKEAMVHVLKSLYGITDTVAMGELLGRVFAPEENTHRLYTVDLATNLLLAFPGTTSFEIVKAFRAYGLPASGGGDTIVNWLRSFMPMGVPDKELASYLGPKGMGLELPARRAVEIMVNMGYGFLDATHYLLQCGYEWSEFYPPLVNEYGDTSYSRYLNTPIVMGLKKYYDKRDIASGEFAYWDNSSSHVLASMIKGGYTQEEALYALLWVGGIAAQNLVVALVDDSISRANDAHKQSLRINAVQAATKVYAASLAVEYDRKQAKIPSGNPIRLDDIAVSLVRYGPKAEGLRLFPYFSDWEVLAAMESLFEMYLATSDLDLPVRVAALASLRSAGASAADCAAMLAAHKVGLSTSSIVKGVFGLGNDWFDAVTALAGAGFGWEDAVYAVYHNSTYHNIIGITVLSSLTTSAIGQLSQMANLGNYITVVKEIAKIGFKIGEGTFVIDGILRYCPEYWYYKGAQTLNEYVPVF